MQIATRNALVNYGELFVGNADELFVVAPRASGKTRNALALAYTTAFHGDHVCYVSPSSHMSINHQNIFYSAIHGLPHARHVIIKKQNLIRFENGAIILFRASLQHEVLPISPKLIIVEESAHMDNGSLQIIRAVKLINNAKLLCMGTPVPREKGTPKQWFEALSTASPMPAHRQVVYWESTLDTNEIERARRDLSEQHFKTDILGQFAEYERRK